MVEVDVLYPLYPRPTASNSALLERDKRMEKVSEFKLFLQIIEKEVRVNFRLFYCFNSFRSIYF